MRDDRTIDLVVHAGMSHTTCALGHLSDWLVRGRVDRTDQGLYEGLKAFLRQHSGLFDRIGKVVMVTDCADRFEAAIAQQSMRIGYIRIGQDAREPEYMVQLLGSHGGLLLTEYLKPGELLDQQRCVQLLKKFSELGIRDIAVNSAYQLKEPLDEQKIISMCSEAAPGQFRYHRCEPVRYVSFLLTENRLLADVCIHDLFVQEYDAIERACRSYGSTGPILVLSGEGYCIDRETAMRDPLSTWHGSHAARLIGAATLSGVPDAIAITPYGEDDGLVLDRIRAYQPVAMGRTKRFYGLQVAGPFPRTVEFPIRPPRYRLLESLRSLHTGPGPLPVLDLLPGGVDLQDLSYQVYHHDDTASALITGVQCAPFRKEFSCLCAPHEDPLQVRSQLHEAGQYFLEHAGFSLADVHEEFVQTKTRYLQTEYERLNMILSGRIVPSS